METLERANRDRLSLNTSEHEAIRRALGLGAELHADIYRSCAMPRTATLHGAAPDESETVLLVIDLISDFSFDDGEKLARAAQRIANNVANLCRRARKAGVPIIYVNDSGGRWRSDRSELLERCCHAQSLGRTIVQRLEPADRDYFIFKPKHSGFFATPLDALLEHLGARTLILTGITIEQCVLFTAMDAYVRNYELVVPRDAVAGLKLRNQALQILGEVLKASIIDAASLRLVKRRKRTQR